MSTSAAWSAAGLLAHGGGVPEALALGLPLAVVLGLVLAERSARRRRRGPDDGDA